MTHIHLNFGAYSVWLDSSPNIYEEVNRVNFIHLFVSHIEIGAIY